MNIKPYTLKPFFRIFLATILFSVLGCEGYKHPNLPNVWVNFWIYPNDANNDGLILWGGHMYFTGGVNGVVVYRLNESEFRAYDRACPHDWDDEDEPRVGVEDDGITLKCEKCGSLYNILDGGVISGPSRYALKYYKTKYDGMRLRVHS